MLLQHPPVSCKHILLTGQSLSIGTQGSSPLRLDNYRGGWMFSNGVNAGSGRLGSNQIIPLQAATDNVQTIAQSCCQLLQQLAPGEYMFSSAGVVGANYNTIRSGTANFTNSITQITNARNALGSINRVYELAAIAFIHGESDTVNSFYNHYPSQFLSDYRSNYQVFNKQVKLFTCQTNSWTKTTLIANPFTGAAVGQLTANDADPNNIILVCPKYHLTYADGIHLNAAGYRQLGEYYAYAMYKVLDRREQWLPCKPLSISAVNTGGSNYTITVTYAVPDGGDLAIDTSLVSDPGNNGFEVLDIYRAPCTIASVSVSGQTVTITTTAGIPYLLRYAFSGTPNANAGATTGPRGNIRSTTQAPSLLGFTNYHWSVAYERLISNSTPATAPTQPALTNLVGYWDASTNVTSSGGLVSNWQSRWSSEASPQNFVQATSGNQFTLTSNQINSLPALVASTAGARRMICTFSSAISFTGVAVFLVCKIKSNTANFSHFCGGKSNALANATSSGDSFLPGFRQSSIVSGYAEVGSIWRGTTNMFASPSNAKVPIDRWFILSYRVISGTGMFIYLNGLPTPNSAAISNYTLSLDEFTINYTTGGNTGSLDFAAVALYKSGLSDADFWTTHFYLQSQFNIGFGDV